MISIYRNFKENRLMCWYMKNKPIKWGFKFWIQCGSKSGYVNEFETYLGKKTKTEFGLGEPVVLSLSESLPTEVATVACLSTNFLQVQNWCWSCWKTRFMELKQSRQIKNVRFLWKQISKWKMKRSEHDWRACGSFSATKWQESIHDFVVKLSWP